MLSKVLKNYCKYIPRLRIAFQNPNIRSRLFHTSRGSILPSMAQREDYTLDYLHCLRPAEMAVSDAQTLAGEPRLPGRYVQGIESEVFKKWNQTLKMASGRKDWSSFTWWGRPFH